MLSLIRAIDGMESATPVESSVGRGGRGDGLGPESMKHSTSGAMARVLGTFGWASPAVVGVAVMATSTTE